MRPGSQAALLCVFLSQFQTQDRAKLQGNLHYHVSCHCCACRNKVTGQENTTFFQTEAHRCTVPPEGSQGLVGHSSLGSTQSRVADQPGEASDFR